MNENITTNMDNATLERIEQAATKRQVIHTLVNGEPDPATNDTLALVREVRQSRSMIDDALELHAEVDGRCAVCVTAYENYRADGSLNTSVNPVSWPCATAEALGATRD